MLIESKLGKRIHNHRLYLMANDNLIVWVLEQKVKEKTLVLFECPNHQRCHSVCGLLRFDICLQSIIGVFPGNFLEIYGHIGSWLDILAVSHSSRDRINPIRSQRQFCPSPETKS